MVVVSVAGGVDVEIGLDEALVRFPPPFLPAVFEFSAPPRLFRLSLGVLIVVPTDRCLFLLWVCPEKHAAYGTLFPFVLIAHDRS